MIRPRLISLAVAIFAVAFFGGPIALRAVGVRAHAFENRPFAPRPKLADGWKIFDDATLYLIDRMPARQQAVRANTWISQHLFASTPQYGSGGPGGAGADPALPFSGRAAPAAPGAAVRADEQVVAGTDGWLYLQDVFGRACHEPVGDGVAAARWLELVRIVRASGRRVVLVVPPDKSTIYPEFVKASTPDLACSRAGERRLWSAIESRRARRAGVIGLRRPLLAAKRTTRAPLYYRKDSHWDTLGALTLVRAVVPALDPAIQVRRREVRPARRETYIGDLTLLLGAPQTDTSPARTVRRAAGAPVIGGRSVLVGDSFGQHAYPLLAPYFAHLRFVSWTAPGAVAPAVARADTVVLEVVERQFNVQAARHGVLTPAFLRRLRQRLR